MTTILLINAASSLLAALGLGGFLVQKRRSAGQKAAVELAYVTRSTDS
jgi:hypothetical protein